jgi:hypothetical protein
MAESKTKDQKQVHHLLLILAFFGHASLGVLLLVLAAVHIVPYFGPRFFAGTLLALFCQSTPRTLHKFSIEIFMQNVYQLF